MEFRLMIMRVIVFFTGLLIIPIKQDLKSGPALILYHEKEWHNCFKGLVVLNVIDRLNKLDNNICINKDASKTVLYTSIIRDTIVYSIIKNISDSIIRSYDENKFRSDEIFKLAIELRLNKRLDELAGIHYNYCKSEKIDTDLWENIGNVEDSIILYNESEWDKAFKGLICIDLLKKFNFLYGRDCSNSGNSERSYLKSIQNDVNVIVAIKEISDSLFEKRWGNPEDGPVIMNQVLMHRMSKGLDSLSGVYHKK
jgi:single-stranded DNA-specific DHH superfamily exonuclease